MDDSSHIISDQTEVVAQLIADQVPNTDVEKYFRYVTRNFVMPYVQFRPDSDDPQTLMQGRDFCQTQIIQTLTLHMIRGLLYEGYSEQEARNKLEELAEQWRQDTISGNTEPWLNLLQQKFPVYAFGRSLGDAYIHPEIHSGWDAPANDPYFIQENLSALLHHPQFGFHSGIMDKLHYSSVGAEADVAIIFSGDDAHKDNEAKALRDGLNAAIRILDISPHFVSMRVVEPKGEETKWKKSPRFAGPQRKNERKIIVKLDIDTAKALLVKHAENPQAFREAFFSATPKMQQHAERDDGTELSP